MWAAFSVMREVAGGWVGCRLRRWSLPEFGGEDAGEELVVGDAGHAGVSEGCCVVGEVGGAEAGEDAEGQVEAADEELRGETHGAGGDAEVGE